MKEKTKLVRIKISTAKELEQICGYRDTYNSVIERMLHEHKVK